MSRIKRLNTAYSGGIPLQVGDRYYGQDIGRDFNSMLDFMGTYMRAITNLTPQLLRGGYVTKGTNFDDINITPAFGIVGHQVTTPDDFSSLPPTTQTEDILALIVESIQQTNFDIATTGTLDGVTTNYVKLRYKETETSTRDRAKKSGSWIYEVEPTFEIVVNDTAPTIYDCLLATFVGDGSTVLTITQEPPFFIYEEVLTAAKAIDVGHARETIITLDTSGGAITLPSIIDGNESGQKLAIVTDGTNDGSVQSFTGKLPTGDITITNERALHIEWNGSKWIALDEITARYTSGDYIVEKSAVGVMEDDYVSSSTITTNIASGSAIFHNSQIITFPEAFSSIPRAYPKCDPTGATVGWGGQTRNKSTTQLTVQIVSSGTVSVFPGCGVKGEY